MLLMCGRHVSNDGVQCAKEKERERESARDDTRVVHSHLRSLCTKDKHQLTRPDESYGHAL